MFHAKDGFYFNREVNGDITVLIKAEPGLEECETIREIKMTKEMFASVVASMSKRDETTPGTFKEALDFLTKE